MVIGVVQLLARLIPWVLGWLIVDDITDATTEVFGPLPPGSDTPSLIDKLFKDLSLNLGLIVVAGIAGLLIYRKLS